MTHETITHKDVNRFAENKNNPPDPKGHGGKFLFRGGLAENLLRIVF